MKARIVAGQDVRLLNISRRGILLETDTRLLPNSVIAIRFVTDDASVVLKGCVVRSSIAMLSRQSLHYQTAVAFDQDISVLDESLWTDHPPATADAIEPSGGPVSPDADAAATVTAVVDGTRHDLHHLLSNDW